MTDKAAAQSTSVLVVEDDPGLRTLFVALLTRSGFTVQCVNDGADALSRLEVESFSVVILDLMMPVANGFDVLERLAKTRPSLLPRVIIATGVAERESQKLDARAVHAVLRKPFDINTLVGLVTECAAKNAAQPHDPLPRVQRSLDTAKRALSERSTSGGELLLRSELRRTMDELSGVLFEAAIQTDSPRARDFERLGAAAARLAQGGSTSQREH